MAEIVAMVASVLGPAVELGKDIGAPIKRQFHYLCSFNSITQTLRNEAQRLDGAKAGLQMQKDEAEYNGKTVLPEVENWLTSCDAIQLKLRGTEIEIRNVQSGLSTIKSRFSLSRKAEKLTKAIRQIIDCCKFDHIYVSAPPIATELVPLGLTYDFDSRKPIEEDIMKALKDRKINLVGICGIGGVGKTTMAKKIMNRVMEEHLFDEVVMLVVSQQVDMSIIQLQLAESLGLTLEQQTLSVRAQKLRVRLMGRKRTLVVLDDVWEMLKLEDIGIPCEIALKRCTILLTSRNTDIFSAMNVQEVFTVQLLSAREAWLLFKEKVSTCVDALNLVSVAKEIVKECKGLPTALITVARALRGKENKSIWADARRQLKISNPIDMPYFLAEVYNPLKLSYDFLDSQHVKSIFLLCSMFPEDHNIPLEDLTLYGWGLRMFEGIRNLEEARNNACALIDMLKSRSLLLDGRDEHHVKMHDVIRDTALFIASKEGCFNLNSGTISDWWTEHSHMDCNWISLFPEERTKLPTMLIFQNLRFLLVNCSRGKKLQIHDKFFEGTSGLNVLSISFTPLPQTIQLLKHLRTLLLYCCNLDSISVIGELSSLEILRFHGCDSIKELPKEIGRLDRLRLLEFLYCKNIETIAPGVISQLVRLEELKIVGSFDKWDNAALSELELLSNLTCLEIEIKDFALATEELCLPQLVKYKIKIGKCDAFHFFDGIIPKRIEKKMHLDFPRTTSPGNWIHKFVKSSECLCLRDDLNDWDLSQSRNMKFLQMNQCPGVKSLVNTVSASTDSQLGILPSLETLWLYGLDNLEEICDGPIPKGSNSFKNMKELEVKYLPALKHLWGPNQNVSLSNLCFMKIENCRSIHNLVSLAVAKDSLVQLEELQIISCEMMEQVFFNENDGQSGIVLPKLKTLLLSHLTRLTTFCRGIEYIEFPLLTEMDIKQCPKLIGVVSSTRNNPISQDRHDDNTYHLFCNEKVAFGNLKKLFFTSFEYHLSNIWCLQTPNGFFNRLGNLKIGDCDGIRSLFSSSVARNLVNLKRLDISCCQEMIKVIEDEENVSCDSAILFPNLELVLLGLLPKLETFCEWRCALQLPSLKRVAVGHCFRILRFSLGSISTPNLETVNINDKIFSAGDLNGILQRCIDPLWRHGLLIQAWSSGIQD